MSRFHLPALFERSRHPDRAHDEQHHHTHRESKACKRIGRVTAAQTSDPHGHSRTPSSVGPAASAADTSLHLETGRAA